MKKHTAKGPLPETELITRLVDTLYTKSKKKGKSKQPKSRGTRR